MPVLFTFYRLHRPLAMFIRLTVEVVEQEVEENRIWKDRSPFRDTCSGSSPSNNSRRSFAGSRLREYSRKLALRSASAIKKCYGNKEYNFSSKLRSPAEVIITSLLTERNWPDYRSPELINYSIIYSKDELRTIDRPCSSLVRASIIRGNAR